MPPPEEVPITTVPGGNQAAETIAVEPPAVRESRKRGHEGSDANAPPKSLRRDHTDLRPSEWGVTNGSLLDTPEACQDLTDHAVPPGYFTELRHMPNEEFLRQYNVNLARQVDCR
nr:hypothetical protein [Tanacetum cinerariifolium]